MDILSINNDNYKDIINGEKPVLVKYWAPWCTYCRRLDPSFKKVAQDYGDSLVIGELNIDESEQIAEENGVDTIPTLILYRNGEAVDHIVNPQSKAKIASFIKENIG